MRVVGKVPVENSDKVFNLLRKREKPVRGKNLNKIKKMPSPKRSPNRMMIPRMMIPKNDSYLLLDFFSNFDSLMIF